MESIDTRLNKLKTTFSLIINKRNVLLNTFMQQLAKIQLLKTNYIEYIKNNNSSVLVFGLDSFHFQSKLLDTEYNELNKFFLIINNRIYCEYFKLYKIIIDYLIKNIYESKLLDMTKTINKFPVYKDLEPYKEYDIQIVYDIYEQIILLLTEFNLYITNKESILKIHIENKNIGFNLDNFVNTYNYDITIIREKMFLFFDYIDFFHKIHHKYFNTFSGKLNLMILELNRDINIENEKSDELNIELNNQIYKNNIPVEEVLYETIVEDVADRDVVKEIIQEDLHVAVYNVSDRDVVKEIIQEDLSVEVLEIAGEVVIEDAVLEITSKKLIKQSKIKTKKKSKVIEDSIEPIKEKRKRKLK